ncbi:MAG: dTDP-4-keto-6-deoxy-D-glucose epimerase [Chloroflexi bacterium]|nr:MAG: dTDP-4-keto-6-deoxy-D-glucose epimerase [Chloroflexota bacterium]
MKFHSTEVAGAFIVEPEPRRDDRGFLARTFCVEEFGQHGLHFAPVQSYQSRSHRKGTVRGLHYQVAPAAESKLVRCIVGAIYDVILDVRPDSPTYLRSFGVELAADNRLALYVPELVAHGTQALTDGAELLCLAGHAYAPECERGVRYDDPILGNRWPLPTVEVSLKDLAWPPLRSAVGAPR